MKSIFMTFKFLITNFELHFISFNLFFCHSIFFDIEFLNALRQIKRIFVQKFDFEFLEFH